MTVDLSFSREEKLGDLGKVNFRVKLACLAGGIPAAGLLRTVGREGTEVVGFFIIEELGCITATVFLTLVGRTDAVGFFLMTEVTATDFLEGAVWDSLFNVSGLWV